ncbi:MAG: hypothetical protein ACXVA9_09540, partial [Bdellovibrionales bacterium]
SIITLVALSMSAFQNCGKSPSPAQASPEAVAQSLKALGIYDPAAIVAIDFEYSGGMLQYQPEVDLTLNAANQTLTGIYSIHDQASQTQTCSATLAIPTTFTYQKLIDGLTHVSVVVAHHDPNLFVSDCGFAILTLTLADATQHSYQFYSQACSPEGALTINDPGSNLNGLLASITPTSISGTCP